MMLCVAEIEAHDEVVEWFDELSHTEWERTVTVVDRLASLGTRARMSLSRSLGEGLFEVRFTLGALLGVSPTDLLVMAASSS